MPVINGMRDAFDLVVISLDWHPHHHCSFVETANAGQLRLDHGRLGPDPNDPMQAAPKEARAVTVTYTPFESVKLREDADRPAAWSKCSLGPARARLRASSGHAWRLWAARHSRREARPLGAQPLPPVLEPAASKVAHFPAFDHPGLGSGCVTPCVRRGATLYIGCAHPQPQPHSL